MVLFMEIPVLSRKLVSKYDRIFLLFSTLKLNFCFTTGPYLPTWQSFPVVPVWAPYNWDIVHSDVLRDTLLTVLETKEVVIGTTLNSDGNDTEWIKGYLGENNGGDEPYTAFYYPIMNNSKVQVTIANSSELVGVFAMTISWQHLIKNILPEGSNGVYVVFGNECNQTFTYKIYGPQSVYVGDGDKHESKYDHMEVSFFRAFAFISIFI